MVGWHHQLDGHESEQVPGDGEGQGSLACCGPRGRKESDTTERLNNSNLLSRQGSAPLSLLFFWSICPQGRHLLPQLERPIRVGCRGPPEGPRPREVLPWASPICLAPSRPPDPAPPLCLTCSRLSLGTS